MPGGGHLALRGRPVEGGLEVQVVDTGVGIAPVSLGRIMEPLSSTKTRGLGLGLALARAIVDKHQGALRAASVPGEGSTFTVRLLTRVQEENNAR